MCLWSGEAAIQRNKLVMKRLHVVVTISFQLGGVWEACVLCLATWKNKQISSFPQGGSSADVNYHKANDVNRDLIMFFLAVENLSFCRSFPRDAAVVSVGLEPFFIKEFLVYRSWWMSSTWAHPFPEILILILLFNFLQQCSFSSCSFSLSSISIYWHHPLADLVLKFCNRSKRTTTTKSFFERAIRHKNLI